MLALGFALLLVVQPLSLQWAGNVFAHLVHLPVECFEKRHLGDITSRFSVVQAIQKTLTTAAVESVPDGLMAVAALVMMLIYAPALAAVTLAAVLACAVLRWASYSPFRNAAAERLLLAARESSHSWKRCAR